VFLTGGARLRVGAACGSRFLLVSTLLFASQAHEVPKYFIEPYQFVPALADREPEADADAVRHDRDAAARAEDHVAARDLAARPRRAKFGGTLRLWAGAR